MSAIRVTFACGHTGTIGNNPKTAPVCDCGETRIARTFARAPHFRGACTGPYAESQPMQPGTVNCAPAGALRMKTEE